MRRVIAVVLLALLALSTPGTLLARRAAGVLEYTTNVQKTAPSAAACVSVTPSGTSFAYSNWFQIIASTSTPIAITGFSFEHAVVAEFSIAVGTGAAASETQVAEIASMPRDGANQQVVEARVPIEIPTGTRVAIRMKKFSTSTANWCFALTYLERPIVGLATTTASAQIWEFPASGVTPSGSAWANSSYVVVNAATSTIRTIHSIAVINEQCLNTDYEVDLATGAAASEVVKTTVKGHAFDSGGGICIGTGTPQHLPIYPPLEIPAGVRLTVRMRKSTTSTNLWHFRPNYVTAGGLTRISTALAQKWVPSAAGPTTVTSGGAPAYTAGSWVQFIASTATPIAVTGLFAGLAGNDAAIVEIGVGAAASEAVVGRMRFERAWNTGNMTFVMRPAINIASGQRVSIRLRHKSASSTGQFAIGYIENPDFDQRTNLIQDSLPSNADGVTLTPPASSFGNSSWVQLSASMSHDALFTALSWIGFQTPRELEFDLGTGAASSEASAGTVRTHYIAQGSTSRLEFMVPVLIRQGTRVSVRMRGSGTSTTTGRVSAEFLDSYTPAGGGVPFIIGGRTRGVMQLQR